MDVCKCGAKLTSHVTKAGKVHSCTGCGRYEVAKLKLTDIVCDGILSKPDRRSCHK